MAAFEVIALDTATPQLRAPGASDTYTFPRAVEMPLNTANGVLYLNGSKVVTSGSALTYSGGALLNTGSFAPTDGTNIGEIKINAATLDFNTSSSGVPQVFRLGSSEQMRLTSTGLGIGTSSPGAKLDVVGASSNQIRVGTAATEHYRIGRNASDGLLDFYGSQTGYQGYRFGGIDGTWAVIDSSGNLGLGVTPSAWASGAPALQMQNGSLSSLSGPYGQVNLTSNAYASGSADIGFTTWRYARGATGDLGAAARYTMTGSGHSWYTAPSGTAGDAISFSQVMTLDASGNLGVGTTSPTSGFRLDVQATTARQRIESTTGTNQVEQRLINTGGTFYVSLDNSTGTGFGAAYAATLWYTGNYPMLFATNNTERARIPAAGGMVVGTAALATTATDGFLYVPTCAGTPTGTPTTQTGTAPIVVDTTNNKLYFYSGGQWRDAGP